MGIAAGAGLGSTLTRAQSGGSQPASDKVVVGVMGMGGRGRALAESFEAMQGVEVSTVCDVDEDRAARTAAAIGEKGNRKVRAVRDFRRILDDPDVDLLAIATCNHWHAPAAIMACNAGKHVYVEKPGTHNPREGELLMEAAGRNGRLVQHGTQRRSWPKIVEGMRRLQEGVIGRVYYAHCYYQNKRESIGRGRLTDPPAGLDYDLWQGPAPRRPFKDNMLHYNWHWHWHWGNGELGNNGVHALDVARWGLQVDYPGRVHYAGERYRHEDDQETPDTSIVTYEFPGRKMITWQGLSCSPFTLGEKGVFVTFTGEEGTLSIVGSGYVIHDAAGKEVERVAGSGGNDEHTHVSSLLCHLGNISHRVDRMLKCDPAAGGRIVDDEEADAFWQRNYEPGWGPESWRRGG
jgi:predicted dehydrogenase